MLFRPHFGSNWDNSANCSSRRSNWNNPALNLNANNGGQGVTETGENPHGAYPTAEHISLPRWANTQQGSGPGSRETEPREGHFMKRHGNLWAKVVEKENLYLAFRKAKKGKGWQHTVQRFEENIDTNLEIIRKSLINKTFTTSDYLQKEVYEPKQRTIYVLPFAPDRIVQHAIMNILEPIWNSMMIGDSHACRKGKGQHSASRRAMEFTRQYHYCFQADVRKFYPSINHNILMKIIEKKVKDPTVLWLLGDIIYSMPGETNVPIGNYTSQWFGNLYLNELDMFVKHELREKSYLRYNDDFMIFGNDKKRLHYNRLKIEAFLKESLALTMAKDKVFPVTQGLDFVGYRHFPGKILLRKRTAKRVKKRIGSLSRKVSVGKISPESARSSIASTEGWIKWANTYNFSISLQLEKLKEKINGRCA